MTKKNEKEFIVRASYTVRGQIYVFAENEDQARERALDEFICPQSCEVVDWETAGVEEAR
jgi:hypothetical protein